jgi:hypothetical protein
MRWKVLRTSRVGILGSGLMIAIENHAGDMQAREVKTLIEERDRHRGLLLDSGNPLWASRTRTSRWKPWRRTC